MERIDENTVKHTEAERVVIEWHDALMDSGLSQAEALKQIEDRIPQPGATWNLLQDLDFRAYLLD